MAALLIVAALTAQAAAPSGAPELTSSTTPGISSGQRSYVDLEAGVGYSTNPQLAVVNDQGSGYGRIALHAVHSRVSARSTTLLSGYAENVSYTNNQSSQQSLSFFGRHETAVSEHVRLFGDAIASYQEGGQLDTRVLALPLVPPPTPGGTVTPPILIIPNGDFLSVTGRTYSFAAHGGGTFALSPRDNLSVSSGVDHVVFHSLLTNTSYTTIPATLAFDRVLSARTTVGARLVAQHTDYNGPANVRVITPQATARILLAERLSFSGAIGMSFARFDNGLTVRNSTGVAADASLCGQGETSFFCARLAVEEQAATTAGPARSVSGGIDFTQRLDANQSIQFSLSAAHYSTPISVLIGRSFSSSNYYRATAAYTRAISTRLFGGINLAARKLTQNGPDPKTDLNASLFIRYRFGDLQ